MPIQAGATPVEVHRILRRSTPPVTTVYPHLLPDALDEAASKLEGYLNSGPCRPT